MTQQIKFEDVKSSYNGKTGCMCGCLGNYSVPTEAARVAHNEAAGYEAVETVNPRSVKLAVSKLNKYIKMSDDERQSAGVTYFVINDEWASVDINGRSTTVYF